ncbi:hypothetical protein V8C37DRAFT_336462 [Trichoderma ceciliae]
MPKARGRRESGRKGQDRSSPSPTVWGEERRGGEAAVIELDRIWRPSCPGKLDWCVHSSNYKVLLLVRTT